MRITRTVPVRHAPHAALAVPTATPFPGQASVAGGPQVLPFGTEPLFRDHPQGELPQVGRALFTMAHARSG
ncbi:hypothetical protein [Streptomyces pseudovenezuelae]|uniref:Uncharacterized protein n=1 Tax=Streptomyces pseudovenezuelae TaxID=67350 RepID=A0ABT6LGL1_9ACTN|nr:hypothetical protein [Streptomyces pseudovenezuelae]MDH6215430.1 hypothetical protein [Streptomyces pseudovenezuelae]